MTNKQMTKKERVEALIATSDIYVEKPKDIPGGQHCGLRTQPVVLNNIDLGIKISVSYYKQNYKNRQMAIDLFELALLEIIK